jgi:membrane associated rhomboid family serine protease
VAFRPNWYQNEGSGGFWSRPARDWSGIRWIASVCLVVFFVEKMLVTGATTGAGIEGLFDVLALRAWYLTDDGGRVFDFLFPVQLFTYMVLHSPEGFSHIFWNMILLWMFGRELESIMGRRAFLRMFVTGGVLGGVLQWGYMLSLGSVVPTVGASGAVYTVMVLYTLKWPRRTILLFMPFPIPVPVVLLMVFKVGGDLLGFFDPASQTAHLAHLGGALAGLMWFRYGDVVGRVQEHRGRERTRVVSEAQSGDRREMDRILGKIQASGLSSLDKRERAFLDRRSKELRERSS